MIIWLASYPRSGNTFFRILLNHLYSVQTYSIYNDPLFDKLEGSQKVIGHQKLPKSIPEMVDDEKLYFVKTHHLPSDDLPAIYLVRDGRDSIISYARYITSFRHQKSSNQLKQTIKNIFNRNSIHEVMKSLIVKSDVAYGNWGENVTQWTERKQKTVLIRFEDLIKQPEKQIQAALSELTIGGALPKQDQDFPSFEELHEKWPQFFRKGISKNWQTEMEPKLQNLFWQYHGEVMQKLNYVRE